jgi:hypothetical protein
VSIPTSPLKKAINNIGIHIRKDGRRYLKPPTLSKNNATYTENQPTK